jgi:hypothetical protein
MKLVRQVIRFGIGAVCVLILAVNTLTLLRAGLALALASQPEPSLRLASFLGALLLELLALAVLKRVLRRSTTAHSQPVYRA